MRQLNSMWHITAAIAKIHLPPFPSKQPPTYGYFAKIPPKSEMLVCKVEGLSTTNLTKASGQLKKINLVNFRYSGRNMALRVELTHLLGW